MATQGFINFLTTIYGEKEISSAIGKLRKRLDFLKPVLDDIGEVYVESTKLRISSQTTPQGRVWPHNTVLTQRLKENGIKKSLGRKTFMKQGGGGTFSRSIGYKTVRKPAIEGQNKRLVWTGDLRSKIKYRVSGNTVYVIADTPYATTVHFGAEKGSFEAGGMTTGLGAIPWGDIPPRPFLGSNKKTNEKVMTMLGNYLLGNEVAKSLGFRS